MGETEVDFFAGLARSRGAASALLRDGAGRLLLVEPTYKPGWTLPGGVIEHGESPLAACRRECAEELGFVPGLSGLVCVDWLPPHTSPDGREATIFTFAGALAPGDYERVVLPPEELSAAALVEPGGIGGYLPEPLARRVTACLNAEAALYLEHGYAVP